MERRFKRLLVASLAVGVMSFSPIIFSENNLQIASVAYAEDDREILESAEDNELSENENSEQIDNKTPAQQKLDEGNELYNKKNYRDAISKYDEVIQINPNNVTAYYIRGNAYKELKNYKVAIADYDKAIELNPNFAEAYNNRGVVYKALGKNKKAEADFAEAKKLGYDGGKKF